MRTVVQIRPAIDGGPTCDIVHGDRASVLPGRRGPLAKFAPGEVVAYLIQGETVQHLYVFRTLDGEESGSAAIPGVRARVRLLVEVHSAGRIERLRRLFAYLMKRGVKPSQLSDHFYVRVSLVLGGRLPAHKVVRSLLHHEYASRSL